MERWPSDDARAQAKWEIHPVGDGETCEYGWILSALRRSGKAHAARNPTPTYSGGYVFFYHPRDRGFCRERLCGAETLRVMVALFEEFGCLVADIDRNTRDPNLNVVRLGEIRTAAHRALKLFPTLARVTLFVNTYDAWRPAALKWRSATAKRAVALLDKLSDLATHVLVFDPRHDEFARGQWTPADSHA